MDFIVRKNLQKPQSRRYFTQETEDAILKYNSLDDDREKERIYQKYIHFPFFKLTQNIIHTFKFYHTDVERLEHLQHEIIVFLLDKIHLFDQGRSLDRRFKKLVDESNHEEEYIEGEFQEFIDYSKKVTREQTKAFAEYKGYEGKLKRKIGMHMIPKAYSYFGTIVKRYCITYSNKNYDKKINKVSVNDLHKSISDLDYFTPSFSSLANDSNADLLISEIDLNQDLEELPGYKEKDKLSWFIDRYIEHCDKNLEKYFYDKEDQQIADSILELFRKRDALDVFNKKALYICIREMVDVTTPKITKNARILGNIFKEKYQIYLDHGIFQDHIPRHVDTYK